MAEKTKSRHKKKKSETDKCIDLLQTVFPAAPPAIEFVLRNFPQNWLLICPPALLDALGMIRQS